jgi:replicative DNA helicase
MSKQNLFSESAEQALLGACLIDPEATAHLIPDFSVEYLYFTRHRRIWRALRACHEQHGTFDYRLLIETLEQAGELESAGGAAYVASLINSVASAIHAPEYATVVRHYAAQRAGVGLASDIAALAHQDADPEALFSQIGNALTQVMQRFATGRGARPLSAWTSELYDVLQALHDGQSPAVSTGIHDLDRLLSGGFFRSDLLLTAARPGVGKTTFLNSLGLQAAQRGKRVLFCSLEMSGIQLTRRLVAGEAQLDSAALRSGQLAAEEWVTLTDGLGRLADLPLWIDDTPNASLSHLRATAQAFQLHHGLDLLLVDYVQLIQTKHRSQTRTNEVGRISGQLKALARQLEVPVLAASQLNRALEYRQDKRPTLSDLRASGRLEQDADAVLFLHRPGLYDAGIPLNLTEVIVAKHRHGPTGTVDVLFQPRWQRFVGAAAPQEVAHA